MWPLGSLRSLLSAVLGDQTEGEGHEVNLYLKIPAIKFRHTHTHSDFSTILCKIKWPFSSSISTHSLATWDKRKEQFSDLFSLLLKLDPHNSPGGILSVENREKNMSDPLLFPLEQLVQPLRKRFRYHFMGERRTNCKEKVWSCHSTFFENYFSSTSFHSQNGTSLSC